MVFLGGAEASASPSFALPMFITIQKIIILHLFIGVPAATVGGTSTPWHTRGYAPDLSNQALLDKLFSARASGERSEKAHVRMKRFRQGFKTRI